MDLKFSFPLIFWFIFKMIHEKHWEYSAMATESLESMACRKKGMKKQAEGWIYTLHARDQPKGSKLKNDLLDRERGADFFSSEDYGALSKDFVQLEGVQTQQLASISDNCGATMRYTPLQCSFQFIFNTFVIISIPDLVWW